MHFNVPILYHFTLFLILLQRLTLARTFPARTVPLHFKLRPHSLVPEKANAQSFACKKMLRTSSLPHLFNSDNPIFAKKFQGFYPE